MGSPTLAPSDRPTDLPSEMPSEHPTDFPSDRPTDLPSEMPSEHPTEFPSEMPSAFPSGLPTEMPSSMPTVCIDADYGQVDVRIKGGSANSINNPAPIGGGALLPAGTYRMEHLNGCAQIVRRGGFKVNFHDITDPDGPRFNRIATIGNNQGYGQGAAALDTCQDANRGETWDFVHSGGKMSVYLIDTQISDNSGVTIEFRTVRLC